MRVVGRSFKYHRPRGIYTSGPEEPNALVSVGVDDRVTPNTRATQVRLIEGLAARSQNRWPSLRFDLHAGLAALSPAIAAGFYYKTFMRPRALWPLYERGIRKLAGMGCAPALADPDHYDKQYHHCDHLIVGLGPAGIAAALAASQHSGRRVLALDADERAGGSLLFDRTRIDEVDAAGWAERSLSALRLRTNTKLLLRTTAFGYYDDNLIAAIERLQGSSGALIAERVHWIRAKQVILATGAHERPLIFSGNDRPGILLASAARSYLNRHAVTAGHRVAIVTNNDSAYALAEDYRAKGIAVSAIIDVRAEVHAGNTLATRNGYRIVRTFGRHALQAIQVARIAGHSDTEVLECDALCVSGGWSPAIHLHAHAQGTIHYDEALGAFCPGAARQAHASAGSCTGAFDTQTCLRQGWIAGGGPPEDVPRAADERPAGNVLSPPPSIVLDETAFVDLQNDVTVADVRLAAREGFDSVELLKRYTTLGMGTDQGKTSNTIGFGVLAQLTGRSIASLGVTTYRPPYVPVTLSALAGHYRGKTFAPVRQSPLQELHHQAGAVFADTALWRRPRAYPQGRESLQQAVNREVRAVRESVGMVDVSTLGKIDVQGRDALAFLERIYCNRFATLEVGRVRYGLMLREDGIVLDDGTTGRLGEHQFFMTTSTANAGKVMSHLEQCRQVFWPELDVHLSSVTDQWCAIAVAGPNSRALLESVLDADLNPGMLPPLGILNHRIGKIPVRLFRVSFSGELAFEVYTPADFGPVVWRHLFEAGKRFEITAYGTDALTVLRVEKGHVAGAEIDGRTTPADLGLGKLRATYKDYIGRRLGERPGVVDPTRPSLVGLIPVDKHSRLRSGAQLVDGANSTQSLGHTTTAVYSETLGHWIALALLSGGSTNAQREIIASSPVHSESVRVQVVAPVFYDPKGLRACS